MRLNLILATLALFGFANAGSSLAQEDEEEEHGFREPLFLSEVDRDLKAPQAVRVGGVVFVSAVTGTGESVDAQLATIYMRAQSLLGNYGMTLADVAQERIYVRAGQSYVPKEELRWRFYGVKGAPASTVVEVAGLLNPEALVAVELIAVANPEEE